MTKAKRVEILVVSKAPGLGSRGALPVVRVLVVVLALDFPATFDYDYEDDKEDELRLPSTLPTIV